MPKTLTIEDMRDRDGEPLEVAAAAVDQLEELLREAISAATDVETFVRNNVMQEALDLELCGNGADPYECWIKSWEAGAVARAQGALATSHARVLELQEHLAAPVFERFRN